MGLAGTAYGYECKSPPLVHQEEFLLGCEASWDADAKAFFSAGVWPTPSWANSMHSKMLEAIVAELHHQATVPLFWWSTNHWLLVFKTKPTEWIDIHFIKWHGNPAIGFLTGLTWIVQEGAKESLVCLGSQGHRALVGHIFSGKSKWKRYPKGYKAANPRGKYLQVNETTEAREGSLVQMSLLPLLSNLHRHASGIGETQEDAGKLGGR